MWICWIALHLENANVGLSLGRLDQLLYDLYHKDIDAGRLTVQEAIELVCCLWLKIGDHVPIVPEAAELMMLRDPNLNARYMSGVNPKAYLKRMCEANIETGATPALHNDKAVIKALMSKGETLEQARDYGAVGCVESSSNSRHYGHTGALLVNLTSALELTLYNGQHRHTGLDRR